MSDLTASFLMVLPPGWARLPALEADRQQLTAVVGRVVGHALPDDLPRDRAEPLRQELRKRLIATVAEAGDHGATAVYLPVQPVDGFTPAVSIVETEVEDESDDSPSTVIAQILADAAMNRRDDEDSGLREVDGGIAARTETVLRRVEPAAELSGLGNDLPEVDDRQVVYSIPVPHREGRWVVLSFSAISLPGADEQLTDALVALFDAIVTTFRWTAVPGAEPTPLELRLAALAKDS